MEKVWMSDGVKRLIEEIHFEGGHVYLVGGAVRDHLLDMRSPWDLDFEVYDMDADTLKKVLSKHGLVQAVGKSFGVFKVYGGAKWGDSMDFSLPRRESKEGRGHRGFMVEVDPYMTTEEASSRRDFTINSMLIDMKTDRLIDHHGGQKDLDEKILRATSKAYMEDPLRVLRGFQLIARYDLTRVDLDTILMSSEMLNEADTISKERIWAEWYKWATRGFNYRDSLHFLRGTGWMASLYPELDALWTTIQDAEWHPEGSAMEHTIRCLEAYERLRSLAPENGDGYCMVFAILLHDIGKSKSTEVSPRSGRIIHPDHEIYSAEIARMFLDSIGAPTHVVEDVIPLVREHMFHRGQGPDDVPSERSIRRLAKRLEPVTIKELARLMKVDRFSGDNPIDIVMFRDPYIENFLRVAHELEVQDSAPEPILKGRHLIEAGLSPGPEFGVILREAYEAQLDGAFISEFGAVAWVKEYLDEHK